MFHCSIQERLPPYFWRSGSMNGGRQVRLEEEYDVLKSQMLVLMADFLLERKDREKLQEEIREYTKRVDDQEKTIRKLATQLDASLPSEEADGGRGNAYRGRSDGTPRRQIRFILPCHPVDEICQQQQQRRVVLPRNGYGVPLIYGGEMKSGYPEEL